MKHEAQVSRAAVICTTRVRVRDLALLADVGINPDEIGRRQPLIVSVEVGLYADRIETIGQTVDYRKIVALAEALSAAHIPLIETFAQRLAEQCLALNGVSAVSVDIDKPFALAKGMANVLVEMRRGVN
ncbi:dihydroneopterin aldolase [Sphingomonas sp. UYEF23]|uniref:dihydroneopterin aldolase n=1 Tax=Sphingomonas sp. UYEF23 TaxID=1756408 RepID=UPI00339B24DD